MHVDRCENQNADNNNPRNPDTARTDNSSSGLGASRPAATATPPPAFPRDSSAFPGDATSAAMRLHALWTCATRTTRSSAAPAWPMYSSSVGGVSAAAVARPCRRLLRHAPGRRASGARAASGGGGGGGGREREAAVAGNLKLAGAERGGGGGGRERITA